MAFKEKKRNKFTKIVSETVKKNVHVCFHMAPEGTFQKCKYKSSGPQKGPLLISIIKNHKKLSVETKK